MIVDDQEFTRVSRQIQELSAQRDLILREATEKPFHAHVEVAGLEKMIARLQEEIEAYVNRQGPHPAVGDHVGAGPAEHSPSSKR